MTVIGQENVKQGEQLNEASVGIALAEQSRESITRTIEEVEPLNPTALVRDEKHPKQQNLERSPAPEGLQDSARGFNPGQPAQTAPRPERVPDRTR